MFGKSTHISPKIGKDLSELEASQYTSKKLNTRHHIFNMIDEDCIPLYKRQAENTFDGIFCEGTVNYQQLASEASQKGARVLILST